MTAELEKQSPALIDAASANAHIGSVGGGRN